LGRIKLGLVNLKSFGNSYNFTGSNHTLRANALALSTDAGSTLLIKNWTVREEEASSVRLVKGVPLAAEKVRLCSFNYFPVEVYESL